MSRIGNHCGVFVLKIEQPSAKLRDEWFVGFSD
jgi:hypothetical protein